MTNTEHELRCVLDFCGLPWDPICLDYHKNDRLIRTLSYHKVSRPTYDTSVGAGEPYRPYVAELLQELDLIDHGHTSSKRE